ncbi:superoxide dismutase family protein [Endozoicomonas sp. 8E]|uniref:superoxide dismutase family protein n=1 Tax=Endozoicomonas sp. 8E TaxID=3035692 RepID=UPI002938F18B|nr:superoxide dismutase family protein [Endozoicomonas sp. 8E]WOG26379.1 superoxide dismutase family protein [Endozoicomonas sp. 8E]
MFNKVSALSGIVVVTAMLSACTSNESYTVVVNQVSPTGVGAELGTVTVSEASGGGVQFTPNLYDLPPGEHGFRVHENPSCEPGSKNDLMLAALAAGGPLDDLPGLTVDDKGFSTVPVVAKNLKLTDLKGRSLVIHSGTAVIGNNTPEGVDSRIACGVFK